MVRGNATTDSVLGVPTYPGNALETLAHVGFSCGLRVFRHLVFSVRFTLFQ